MYPSSVVTWAIIGLLPLSWNAQFAPNPEPDPEPDLDFEIKIVQALAICVSEGTSKIQGNASVRVQMTDHSFTVL